MDPTLFNNLLQSFRDTIFTVLTNGSPFGQLGHNFFRGIAIIMIVIAGVRIATQEDRSFHKLRNLVGVLMIVWAMISLYSVPNVLLGGYSFSELIPRGAFGLADIVGTSTQQAMIAKLHEILKGLSKGDAFSMLHVQDFFVYILITLVIAVLELAMFIVVGFGYLALGAVVIMGPVLIPFMLIPKLDFLFWSWLKALIKYSFYPVIGNVILLGICQLMLSTLNTTVLAGGHATAGAIAVELAQLPLLIIILLAGIYSIFKIPQLVSDIFSGTSSAGTGVQQAVSSAVGAAMSMV